MRKPFLIIAAAAVAVGAGPAMAETVTIATVNNGDMIVMQKLSPSFEQAAPDIDAQLGRARGERAAPARDDRHRDQGRPVRRHDHRHLRGADLGKQGWLEPTRRSRRRLRLRRLLPPVRDGLSYEGTLYALPFYAESSMTVLPQGPVRRGRPRPCPTSRPGSRSRELGRASCTIQASELYGICLRGKPGWGENMAFVGHAGEHLRRAVVRQDWEPQLDTEPWQDAVNFYVDLLNNYGPPGASSNGFNENLALFSTGKCAMWIDATVAAGCSSIPTQSQVADKLGFAAGADRASTPRARTGSGPGRSASLPSSSKGCRQVVPHLGDLEGLRDHGRRERGLGRGAARHAQVDLRQPRVPGGGAVRPGSCYKAIARRRHQHADRGPGPYVGIQYVAIPEFQAIGTPWGSRSPRRSPARLRSSRPLETAQAAVERTMSRPVTRGELASAGPSAVPLGRPTPARPARSRGGIVMADSTAAWRQPTARSGRAAARRRRRRSVNTLPLHRALGRRPASCG